MSTIGQEIASKAGAKLAAGGLIGALALGGGAVATGELSCEAPTEATGHVLIETGLDGAATDQFEVQRVEIEGLGIVDVARRGTDVEIIGVRTNDGATAEVRSEDQGSSEIDFTLDGVTRTLLVSVIDGQLVADLARSVDLAQSVVGDVSTSINGTVDADDQASGDATLNSDADTGLHIEGNYSANGDDLVDQSETGLLGGLGIDLDLDD